MVNRERTGETTSSAICGRATMNNVHPSSTGDHPVLPASWVSRARWCGRGPRASDAAALPRPAAVVRHRRHVLDPGDLEPGRGQGTDRRLTARTRALHEHVDLLQAVLLRGARGLLGGELRGERRRLARALEADVAGARPGQRVALLVGDGHDRVVERRLDVRLPVQDVLLLATLGLLGLGLRHDLPFPALLLRLDLLLARDRLLRALAGARVGVRALPVDRERPAVADALVAPDLDLPLDVLRDLAAEVTFDLVVRVDVGADLHDLLFGEIADLRAAIDARAVDDLEGPGRADAEDVAQGDVQPLVSGEVDAGDTSHELPFSLAAACDAGSSR